jgi:hypothetical protein
MTSCNEGDDLLLHRTAVRRANQCEVLHFRSLPSCSGAPRHCYIRLVCLMKQLFLFLLIHSLVAFHVATWCKGHGSRLCLGRTPQQLGYNSCKHPAQCETVAIWGGVAGLVAQCVDFMTARLNFPRITDLLK